jgi:hypothetical protein
MLRIQNTIALLLTGLLTGNCLAMQADRSYQVGEKALGGTVIYTTKSGTHGYVVANQDQGDSTSGWLAEDVCKDFALFDEDGQRYTDWQLPPLFVSKIMYAHHVALGGFDETQYYWTATPVSPIYSTRNVLYFKNGGEYIANYSDWLKVRCVRTF